MVRCFICHELADDNVHPGRAGGQGLQDPVVTNGTQDGNKPFPDE